MSNSVRWLLFGSAIAFFGIASFLVGGTVGFQNGRSFQLGQSANVNSVGLALNLDKVREGRQDAAIRAFEGELDSHLMGHALAVLEGEPMFDFWRMNAPEGSQLIRTAAEYRSRFPSQAEDREVRQWVDRIVACILSAPKDVPEDTFRTEMKECYRKNR